MKSLIDLKLAWKAAKTDMRAAEKQHKADRKAVDAVLKQAKMAYDESKKIHTKETARLIAAYHKYTQAHDKALAAMQSHPDFKATEV
jgi:hypothetical protein